MPFWNVSGSNSKITNEVTYVNNTYKDSNGNNKLSTVTPRNSSGYVFINSNSQDPIIKKTSYSIQTDGKITYRYDAGGRGGSRQFNSISELEKANLPGYTSATTERLKNDMQKNLVDSAKNQNVGPSTPSVTPGSLPSSTTGTLDLKNEQINDINISSSKQRTKYENNPSILKYPLNFPKRQDAITFTMFEYNSSTLGLDKENQFTGIIQKRERKSSNLGRVILPIQPTIVDNNVVNWNTDTLNPIELAALDLASGVIKSGVEGGNDFVTRLTNTLKGPEQQNIKNALLTGIAGAAIGRNVLARVSGAILNPNLELLFESPGLRTFNYRFQLSPRSRKESESIRSIIRFFKQGMAVQRTEGNLFLKTPNVFDIKYVLRKGDDESFNKDHPYINRVKTCALTNCSVDYTPMGSYMSFDDGAMVSYVLNLSFQELEPIYSDDYTKDIDGGEPNAQIKHIGY